MFKKILFASDGSTASEHAAQMVINLARVHDSHVTVVYAIDPYPFMGGGELNTIGYDSYMASALADALKTFAHLRHLAPVGGRPILVDSRLIESTVVYKGILNAADEEDSDLIMLGSHGRGGIEKLFLGSVASKVVAHSTRPVLVIR
ncbi:MAG: universal stress protein [Cytophagales bacterium]|nr:universal stress protein [Cytophagales bacterium]